MGVPLRRLRGYSTHYDIIDHHLADQLTTNYKYSKQQCVVYLLVAQNQQHAFFPCRTSCRSRLQTGVTNHCRYFKASIPDSIGLPKVCNVSRKHLILLNHI